MIQQSYPWACIWRKLWFKKIHAWEKKWQPTPVFLLGKSHGQRSLGPQSMGSQRVGHNWSNLAGILWLSVPQAPFIEAVLTKSNFWKIFLQTTILLTQRREPSLCSQRFIWLLRRYQNKVCADQVEQLLMKFKKNFYKICLWTISSVSLCNY